MMYVKKTHTPKVGDKVFIVILGDPEGEYREVVAVTENYFYLGGCSKMMRVRLRMWRHILYQDTEDTYGVFINEQEYKDCCLFLNLKVLIKGYVDNTTTRPTLEQLKSIAEILGIEGDVE